MFRKIIILVFIILFNPVLLMAQDEAGLLLEKIKRSQGLEKIDLMNEISVVYRRTDRSKALDFAKQAFRLSDDVNYLPGKALAKKNEGICWFFIGSNDSATLCYRQALDIFLKIGDKKGTSACYNNLGLISQETGKYDEALKYYERSIEMDQKLGDVIGVASTKENIVDIITYQGNSKKALNLLNEIIQIYRTIGYKDGMMRTLINRASIFDNLKQYDKAFADQIEAIYLANKLNDKYFKALAMSNSGLVTFHKGNPDEALKILNQVLEITDEEDDGYDILNTLWIMSEIYSFKKEYKQSNGLLLKILKKYEEIDNKRGEAKVLTSLGRNLIELNEIDKAKGYLMKSLQITVQINARYELLENYRNLAHVYSIVHNFSSADSIQDLFAETYSQLYTSDSLSAIRKERNLNIERIALSKSTTSDWIIAYSLMVFVIMLSMIVFRKNKKEI